jgi:hypothetical protein
MDSHQKAYVCVHVFDRTRPVLLVSRAEGDWCFLCGDMHPDDAASYRVVGLGHVLAHDPSLTELLNLPPDWEAERASTSEHWIRTKCESDA